MQRMPKLLLTGLLLAAIVAGCDRGAQEAGPIPTAPASTEHETTAPTTTSAAAPPATSTSEATPAVARCNDRGASVRVASEEGAAGTIRTAWRVTNRTAEPCRTYGYPGMDFHTASGWLDVRVKRGGYPDIDQAPASVVLAPGQSLYFVSYWSDVTSGAGPCDEFDRVKVTLPDTFHAARLAASGCLDPRSVDVGPVTATQTS
jgi:hypothetical protein